MTTTVAVSEDTYDLLKHAKEETESATFDETIKKLVLRMKQPRKSYYGSLKGLKPFVREELDRFA